MAVFIGEVSSVGIKTEKVKEDGVIVGTRPVLTLGLECSDGNGKELNDLREALADMMTTRPQNNVVVSITLEQTKL